MVLSMTTSGGSAVLVTGATRGLGLETARLLAADPARTVVLAVRDTAAGERVAADLGPATVLVRALDLSRLDDVAAFTVADLPPLTGVVANAGIQHRCGTATTPDGFESTFAVNHLAHALLVDRLLPGLADDARIVFVASGTHDPTFRRNGGFPAPAWPADDPADLAEPGEQPGGRPRYAASKLANVLYARALAARLHAAGRTGLRVNSFDPGLMPGSDLAREYPRAARWAWGNVMPALTFLPGISTTKRSGADLAALVVDPALADLHGEYVVRRRPEPPSRLAQDDAQVAALTAATNRLLAPWR